MRQIVGKDEEMDVWQQDLFFWQLVRQLVTKHQMRIVDISSEHHEVWLEDERLGKNQVIRLVRANLDWANHLRNLLEQGAVRFEVLRRRLFWRRMNGIQVFVMNLPTVDSYEEIANQALFVGKKRKTMTRAVVIENDKEQKQAALNKLFSMLELNVTIDDNQVEPVGASLEDVNRCRKEVVNIASERLEKDKAIFTFGKPRMTFILILIQAMLFLFLELNGGSTHTLTLIEFGAKYNPLIEEGQWWRFVTAMFLHIGFLHVFLNSFALYVIGSTVERIFGSGRFLVIYFTAGLLGSIVSYAFTEQISAGASGAIYGCFGALLYFGVIHRRLFFRSMGMSVLFVLLINLLFGFFMPMIDNNAHLGGLVGGFLASMVVHLPNHKQHVRQAAYFILTALVIVGMFQLGMKNEDKYGSLAIHTQIAYELMEQEEYHKAKQILLEVAKQDAEESTIFFWLSYAEIHLDEFELAKEHLLKAISLQENFHEAHFNLALVYEQLAEYDKALQSVRKAVELNPDDENYVETKQLFEKKYANRLTE